MKVGDRVYKIYCGGQDKVTVIAVHRDTVRVEYPDGRKRTVSKDYIVELYRVQGKIEGTITR